MNRHAATLEAGGRPPVLTADPSPPPGVRGAMKFQYASGARPLEGYTIKRGIGRGGFGEVYFATSDAGKELALKHVERNLDVELRGVGQCLNLKHANLIDLYDVRYDDQSEAWVVMEYVAGPSLKDVLDQNPGGLPLPEVERWFRGLASGVEYLHDHGIVHRDLKPGNIFEDAGTVKIGDYGLSKFISCSRRSGHTESVGTCHYMAPEIGKGSYGKEIDIYALGIILFEMITGRCPFEGESSQEVIMKHLTADPDVSMIPAPYRTLIQRALQKDPEKRFHNVAEMVAVLDGTSVAAPTPAAAVTAEAVASTQVQNGGEPLYIGPEEAPDADEIHFGPVRPVVGGKTLVRRAPPPRVVARSPEEPIAKAVRVGWAGLTSYWNQGPLTTPLKIIVLLVVAAFAIFNGPYLIPIALVFGAVYVVYLGIRMLVQSVDSKVTAPAHPFRGPPIANYRSAGWQGLSWDQQGRAALRMRTFSDRALELSGSMLGAAGVVAVLTLVMLVLAGIPLEPTTQTTSLAAWLWLVTTAGAWLVLVAAKCLENSSGEFIRRRFLMLVLGMAFGAFAFGLSQFLMIDSVRIGGTISGYEQWQRQMFASGGVPLLPAYLAYFGAVFATLGWWKQADPLRSSRLAIGRLLIVFLAGLLWNLVLPFPQPWGYLLPVAVSAAVQLSSPWLTPKERAAIRQRFSQ